MKNIFITNLTTKVGNDDLKEIFEEYGIVSSAKVIMDHYTGKSRGFGFVEMPNDEEAENAIRELNGAELDGKKITVNIAKPKTERSDFNRKRY
ncbi:MAG: RNA-binding protein [Bacteroidales bacterium]|nr:RNA-binding protein [Bacteroidales bacterium]